MDEAFAPLLAAATALVTGPPAFARRRVVDLAAKVLEMVGTSTVAAANSRRTA